MVMARGLSSARPLVSMYQVEGLVKDGLAETFMYDVIRSWLRHSSITSLEKAFRRGGVNLIVSSAGFGHRSAWSDAFSFLFVPLHSSSHLPPPLDQNIYPSSKQSFEYMIERLTQAGDLQDVVQMQESLRSMGVKKGLQQDLLQLISEEKVTDNKRVG